MVLPVIGLIWGVKFCEMKLIILISAFFSFQNRAVAQEGAAVTKIYIVRHAEKQDGKDPLLTPAGNARSGDLMRFLKDEMIRKIYVSQYRRTQNTGDSLRIQLNIDTVHYTADTLCGNLINTIMGHSDFGKTILVIGHSNTIPQVIRKFGVHDYPYGDLADNDYDRLFLITYKNGKAKVKVMKYGAAPGTSATMQ